MKFRIRYADQVVGVFVILAFAALAAEFKVPVVPVAISGAFRALPRGRRLPRFFTRVTVRFLPPIPAADRTDEHKLTDATRDAIARNLIV